MTEERKLVTVLFADIVGSTAATASEDPEVVRNTFSRAFREMREVIAAHGGTVGKFAGDAVMCVFGIPTVHEDDAARALRAAFELRSRIAELSGDLAFPLHLRIGVNTGWVVTGIEDLETLVAMPVNAAARLQQGASPDEILVAVATAALAHGVARFGPIRTIDAKGLGPLEARPAEALIDALPQEHRGLAQMRAPLIGRDRELRRLVEAWTWAVEKRSPSFVTIYGEPGVGKSRLVAELAEAIGPGRVRRGRCLSYGSRITYWPLQEILRADACVAGDDEPAAVAAKIRSAVLAAFHGTSDDANAVAQRLLIVAGIARAEESLPGVAGEDLDKELRWAVRRYLELRAVASPLAMVLDDIHWAEPALLDLIEHLADRARAPLLIVCLARPDLRERRPSWAGGLTNASMIGLEPLGAAEAHRLIAALLSIDDLAEDAHAEIIRRAEGNPLYVEELLRMLLDSGRIARRDGRFVFVGELDALSVPPTLEGLLAARLDRLDAEAKRAVRAASVVGQVFYPGALAALGVPPGEIDGALDRAARRDLVFQQDERGPDGRPSWSFKHLLIRDAAYGSLPKAERWRSHDAMGRWLETVPSIGDVAGIVTHHAERAFWIARELREERARDLGQRALDLALAEARRAWQMEAAPRPKRDRYASVAEIARALQAPELIHLEARARVALARHALNEEGVQSELDAALAAARSFGPSSALVDLLINAGWRASARYAADASRLFAEATSAARAVGDSSLVAWALYHEAWPAAWAGRLSESLKRLQEVREQVLLAEESGARSTDLPHWPVLVRLSATSWKVGSLEAALRYVDELEALPSLAASALHRKVVPHLAASIRARIKGDIVAWVSHARGRMEAYAEIGDTDTTPHETLAEALHAAARHDEALAEIDAAMRGQLVGAAFVGEIRQRRARILLALGRLEEARAEAELAYREIQDQDPFSRSTTSVALGLAREATGDPAEAESLLRQAIDRAGEFRWQAMDARVELARFLMRHGRATEARPLLEAARDFFVSPYAQGWRDRVDALIRECGAAVV